MSTVLDRARLEAAIDERLDVRRPEPGGAANLQRGKLARAHEPIQRPPADGELR